MKKLKDLQKLLVIGSIVGVAIILLSLIGLAFGQPGWLIGSAIGTIISIINVFLMYKGSEASLNEQKMWLFLVSYFGRVILFVIGALITVMGQYYFHVDAFTNSVWGFLIAYTPMTVVVIVIMAKSKSQTTIEKKEEKDK